MTPISFIKKMLPLAFLLTSVAAQAQTSFRSLNYLYSISGNKTIAGQHNDQKDGTTASTYTERVANITGKSPALYSGDFLFHGSSQLRWDVTYEAERQWNAGAIINLMWHACPPNQGAVCNWDGGLLSHLSDAEWNDLITDGGRLNGIWKARIDEISVYLKYLQDKGVEVMWRPLHEMNQGAFWWGGRTGDQGTKRLYQLTRDYMQNVKGLHNLIWVWDVQDLSSNYGDYNPGNAYWDVAALDVYGDGYTNSTYYNALLAQAGNKPVGIGESFTLPNATVLQNQPRWSFFMVWSYGLQQNNTDQAIRDVYNNSRVLNRAQMPGWNNVVPANLAKGRPVTVSSTEAGANVAANAVDGSYASRWSSEYSDAQWLTVDLGANFDINRVKINWEAAYGKDYTVQVSNDGSTWRTIKTVSGNTSLSNDFTGLTGSGRYVRINGTARGTQWGYSMYELEVVGTPVVTASTNLARGKAVAVSSTETGANVATNAVDGNGSTRWSSAYSDAQWIYVDLGASYNVNRVKIAWEVALGKNYTVQTSSDAKTWKTIKTVTGNTSLNNDWTGLSGTGRYVRINGTLRGTVYGYSIYELEVYGSKATTPPGNLPPTVSIASPTSSDRFTAPANINITANASDADGTIARVEYYNGTSLLGTDSSAPYTLAWNNVAAGSYQISVKAFDNLGASSTSSMTLVVNPPATVEPKKVVGYLANWIDLNAWINRNEFAKLTHINVAFENPNDNGDLSFNTSEDALIQAAHAKNVKVFVSIGGGSVSENATERNRYFNLISDAHRADFVNKIAAYLQNHHFDGLDVDLEGPAINADYGKFIVDLSAKLKPLGKGLSAALSQGYGGSSVPSYVFSYFDWINIMAYDATGPWDTSNPGQHSSYDFARSNVDYWVGRGLAKNKAVLGVPFYGYGFGAAAGSYAYSSIVNQYSGAENVDQVGNTIWYNGIPTIKAKVNYALDQQLAGVMIWEISQDVSGSKSLLGAIDSVVKQRAGVHLLP